MDVKKKNINAPIIPTTISKLGDYRFEDCTTLRLIIIPTSVSELGEYCFINCTSLTSIDIPTTVSEIGNGCFDGCFRKKNEKEQNVKENILSKILYK
ncbi:leucine rich repeat protein 1, putative [Entamoeba histolytica HM-3:IMSS]|uniref:Leucine rich repeat protein 1, putative n=1 Tax=Entamoeba histolytica HM-3:IMSS TaxID=885315 RepID=M7WLS8_ENTHI|nr:leucine rich repeat protein 1, putative [Entamoeba histolytica HM-3:IMSS]